jgi:hypothetical protein
VSAAADAAQFKKKRGMAGVATPLCGVGMERVIRISQSACRNPMLDAGFLKHPVSSIQNLPVHAV